MTQRTRVYVVEAGEYEQCCVHYVAASLEAVVRTIRAAYAENNSVLEESAALPERTSWSDTTWYYTVRILEQCGHRLIEPMDSTYEITEWEVSGGA